MVLPLEVLRFLQLKRLNIHSVFFWICTCLIELVIKTYRMFKFLRLLWQKDKGPSNIGFVNLATSKLQCYVNF